ncbi:MAG: enolase C-terminal domain-like protein [Sphaerochaetaceae bacterium]
MNSYFQFPDELIFSKAIYYNFKPIPVKKPWKDATGGFGNYLPLQGWIELFDDNNISAGCFCSLGMITNVLPLILTGEKKSYGDWYHYLYWKFRNFGFQSGQITDLGQFDLLMLELLAKRKNLPLHKFLGAKKDWAAAYKGGGSLLSSDEELVDDMCRYVAEGYSIVKFKVGSDFGKNMGRDLLRMKKVREAVGSQIGIAVDANQVWTVDEALKFAEMIKPYNPLWFEEPVHSQDMNGIKMLKDKGVGLPLGFGESMRDYFSFETYAEKGVDHLMPLVGRMSKMSDLLNIRDLARDKKLRFSSGGTAYLNVTFGALYNENELLEIHEPMVGPMGNYLSVKAEEKNGRLLLPDIIGGPIRLDIEKLEHDQLLDGIKYYYASDKLNTFAIRASY